MKPDPDAALATERLDLEPLVVGHARELYEAIRDPALYLYIDERPPPSLAALETRYRALAHRRAPDGSAVWLNWACRERASGVIAGVVQATLPSDGPALIAYLFAARGQGRGLAREACRALMGALVSDWARPVIEATVHPDNRRSIALLEALGFARTGSATSDLRFRCAASS